MANHVHATLRDFLSVEPSERTVETIERLLRKNWQLYRVGFEDREEERRWAQRALTQLKTFARTSEARAQPLMLEAAVDAEISPGLTLYVRVDRVDGESNGGLHIIDYKTGTRPPQNDWTQLHLQALVLSRKLASPVNRVSFLYLGPSVMDSADPGIEGVGTAPWCQELIKRDCRSH
jgi:RecB family exonuclease